MKTGLNLGRVKKTHANHVTYRFFMGTPLLSEQPTLNPTLVFLGQQLNHSFLWLSSSWQFILAFENTYFYTYVRIIFPSLPIKHWDVPFPGLLPRGQKNNWGPTIEATGASEIPSVFSSRLLGPGNMVSGIVCMSAAAYLTVPLQIS